MCQDSILAVGDVSGGCDFIKVMARDLLKTTKNKVCFLPIHLAIGITFYMKH
jgi:hypothetical protein